MADFGRLFCANACSKRPFSVFFLSFSSPLCSRRRQQVFEPCLLGAFLPVPCCTEASSHVLLQLLFTTICSVHACPTSMFACMARIHTDAQMRAPVYALFPPAYLQSALCMRMQVYTHEHAYCMLRAWMIASVHLHNCSLRACQQTRTATCTHASSTYDRVHADSAYACCM
jgi:hypothetical protein